MENRKAALPKPKPDEPETIFVARFLRSQYATHYDTEQEAEGVAHRMYRKYKKKRRQK